MVYLGGKTKLKKFICPILQAELDSNDYDAYIEPFVGGCNVIDSINYKKKYGFDKNKCLIAFWKALQNGWEMPKPNSFPIEHYKEVKEAFINNSDKYPDYYYGFMMTVPCYNGVVLGSYAKQNVKRDYQTEHYENVIEQIPKIQDVIFEAKDYSDINVTNCLIYCDPPYKDSKKRYYVNKDFNYDNFLDWCEKITSNGNTLFLSETSIPPNPNFKKVWEKIIREQLIMTEAI